MRIPDHSNALRFHLSERFKTKKVKTLAYHQDHSTSQNPEDLGTLLKDEFNRFAMRLLTMLLVA